mmetsp:Transcript_10524/g.31321  ORF Transcript_10524/g.31321 Transcript_10524/m.31321 type:complete len:345 (+) Transcript_10524:65-1099(+)
MLGSLRQWTNQEIAPAPACARAAADLASERAAADRAVEHALLGISPGALFVLGPSSGAPTAEASNATEAVAPAPAPAADRDPAPNSARVVQDSLVTKDITPRVDRAFTCHVCEKTFKRETNLMFHMATHRERTIDSNGVAVDQKWNTPTSCPACPRVFATKYQAKKHFLRRHFEGEKKFTCTVCNVKSFTVKEDLSMHLKSCGRVFSCSCGIRLRSQATLKRHCKASGHAPASWEGAPAGAPANHHPEHFAQSAPVTSALPPPTQYHHMDAGPGAMLATLGMMQQYGQVPWAQGMAPMPAAVPAALGPHVFPAQGGHPTHMPPASGGFANMSADELLDVLGILG